MELNTLYGSIFAELFGTGSPEKGCLLDGLEKGSLLDGLEKGCFGLGQVDEERSRQQRQRRDEADGYPLKAGAGELLVKTCYQVLR